MPRGWEGNRRSGVALAIRYGLKWFIHLRAQRPKKGRWAPRLRPSGVWHLYLYLTFEESSVRRRYICVTSKRFIILLHVVYWFSRHQHQCCSAKRELCSNYLTHLTSLFVHFVSKRISDIIDCNLKKDYQFLMIFGTTVPNATGRQTSNV